MSLLRLLFLKHKLERSFKHRKLVRKARQEAAERGISSEWQRRGAKCREMFS